MARRSIAALVALSLGVAGSALAQDKMRWKMASVVPLSVPIVGSGAKHVTETLETITEGRLRIEPFDPGKLVPATEVFDAVRTGSVDAGWSFSCYWMGKIPAAPLFCTVPFGLPVTFYLSWIYEGGGQELWDELYAKHGLRATPCLVVPPETSGWFRESITSVEDFQGMKLRFPGIAGKVLQKLGASVQLIPAGEIFVALERGIIDGTEFAVPSIDYNLGFYKVAKHYYFPGWHQPSTMGNLLLRKETWESLSPLDQKLVEMTCRDNIVRSIAKFEADQPEALDKIQAEGVEVHMWSPEILDALEKASREVLAEMAAEDEDFAKIYGSLRAFQEKGAQWQRLSHPMR